MSTASPLSGQGSASPYDTQQMQATYEEMYGRSSLSDWAFHDTSDPIVRYLRDRRLDIGVRHCCARIGRRLADCTTLVVCAGVGGEGTYLANQGCRSVAVSDFSAPALAICRVRDPRLQTIQLSAEALDLPDNSYDIVVVQDGLHELRRPVLGLTEMLRVARRAVIVIEPHTGVVARLLGTVYEQHHGQGGDHHSENYVFRWNARRFRDVARSYLLGELQDVHVIRFWDHNVTLGRFARMFGGGRAGLLAAKTTYQLLNVSLWWIGNAMVGIATKKS